MTDTIRQADAVTKRGPAFAGLLLSVALLIPGLVYPVITLRGTLDPAGVAELAPQLLEKGITDSTVAGVKLLLNPALVPIMDAMPGGVKQALINVIGGQIGNSLAGSEPIEVYQQTRSILGSVKHLYTVGSWLAATLILLFSVVVPFTKAAMVAFAMLQRDLARRERVLATVTAIGKWSMADVFAVALIIAYLAATASQSPDVAGGSLIAFDATFGPGFYWFAAYCIVSLATQQMTLKHAGRV